MNATSQSMTSRTESMTLGHVHRPRPRSTQARATRSLRLAQAVDDPGERRAALTQHFEQFVHPSACPHALTVVHGCPDSRTLVPQRRTSAGDDGCPLSAVLGDQCPRTLVVP